MVVDHILDQGCLPLREATSRQARDGECEERHVMVVYACLVNPPISVLIPPVIRPYIPVLYALERAIACHGYDYKHSE